MNPSTDCHLDSPVDARLRIAIVGGGISGLAAAFRLHELLPRAEVKLFEASGRVGGVLDTARHGEFLIERSADNFLTQPPAAMELCRSLGLADELLPTDETRRRAYVVRGNRLLPIPDGFYLMSPRKLVPLFASPLLSWRGKLRLLAEPFVGRSNKSDESVASFARRRLGREAYERLVQPLVAGIYTADPEQLSMAATMPQFWEYERKHGSLLRATLRLPWPGANTAPGADRFNDQSTAHASGARYSLFAAPKNGMASLVNALVGCLPAGIVQLNAPVALVRQQSNGQWKIDFGSRVSNGGLELADRLPENWNSLCFDAVIVANAAHSAARLLETCDPELAADLAAIPYAGCAVVSFGFARRQIGNALNGFGLVVPSVEGRKIIAVSFASQKFPDRAPPDAILIRVFLGGALQPELLQLRDAELRELALKELAALLEITGEPQLVDIARWPNSMPQYCIGHLERVARIEERLSRWPGLELAGNAYRGVGVPQCVASGQAAAERIAGARLIADRSNS
jgi:oxygen-dependent protoporphyrinogen oxidase